MESDLPLSFKHPEVNHLQTESGLVHWAEDKQFRQTQQYLEICLKGSKSHKSQISSQPLKPED